MKDDSTATLNSESVLNRASRLLLSAFVLAALVPVLTLANPATDEPEFKQTLGVYGDWTAYQLEDDALQVCYVETAFIPAPGAEPDFSEVRLQVSNRAFNPGTNLMRFTLTHIFPHFVDIPQLITVSLVPKTAYSLAGLLTPEEYDNGGPFDDELVDEMTSGEVTDVTLTQYQNWEDKNGTRLGSYSMEGFIEAYGAISRACPLRPERPAQAAAQPVRIDGYSSVEGLPKHYEFSLTGPFFEAGKTDKLSIRGIPGNYSEFDRMDEEIRAEIGPENYFVYDAFRWEFYRNGEYVDSFNVGYTRINGVCLSPESGRLKLLIFAWGGGATSPGSSSSVFYEPGEGIYTQEHYAIDAFGPGLVDCLDNESMHEQDKTFQPCLCAGSAGTELYHDTLNQLRSDIAQAVSTKEDTLPRTIDDDTLSALLLRAARIEPFIWWDAYSHLDVQRFESPKYTVVSITFQDRASVFGSVQQVFVRRLTEDVWTHVYRVNGNKKGFQYVTIHGFVDDDNLDMDMCVKDCNWWWRHERVQQNVEEWLQKAASAKLQQ